MPFHRQAGRCRYKVLPNYGKVLRWGVPDGFHDPHTGDLLHDDLLVSVALVAVLATPEWILTGSALVLPRPEHLTEIHRAGF